MGSQSVTSPFDELRRTSYLDGGNAAFIEGLYEDYLADPDSVPDQWRRHFDGLNKGPNDTDIPHRPVQQQFTNWAPASGGNYSEAMSAKQASVSKMVTAYRMRGHQRATLDPLGLTHRPDVADLNPSFHDLNKDDLDTEFATGSLAAPGRMKLRDIVELLQTVYCGNIGAEYMHITDTNQRRWLQQRLEGDRGRFGFAEEDQRRILTELVAAEGLEKYLHSKYVGQKRFSLEGSESLIPLVSEFVQHVGNQGVREMVIGMAHRGRLNVLVNILGKAPAELFDEFEGKRAEDNPARSGDVKYHLGYSSDVPTPGGPVHMAMAFNPSHLEIIDPVVIGSVRARQDRRGDYDRSEVVPFLIHGDAAFAGQGVVMETFNMSQARGFYVGGTVHVIVNNQIGFTTSNPLDARSTLYCTEVAKMVQAPIFHVNGDDPEAVVYVTKLAADYRRTFKKDVVIDLVCYRRHGHNEADEPSATQPMMYKAVRSGESVVAQYAQTLRDRGVIRDDELKQYQSDYRDALDKGDKVRKLSDEPAPGAFAVDWSRYHNEDWDQPCKTAIPKKRISKLAKVLTDIPEDFKLHARVQRIVDDRKKMAAGDNRLDWGFCELVAYGSLIEESFPVRLVGQDSGRGTFFHRHSVLHEQESGDVLIPLQSVSDEPRDFTVIDSLLSEEAVLGFEYGYTTAEPRRLVIWEAQFGDFVNGAQVVIDQFIASGEAKWGRLCGLVMFLPHGYEGQGPEHSSARLERFMQLCAQYNMQVCVPTTPAQWFHMLRRQMLRDYRKPLIVMTPKSLLRHKESTSTLEDLSQGHFHVVIEEQRDLDESKVDRVVACAGKVYYDLIAEAREQDLDNVAIIRVEQLYPFPREAFRKQLERYPNAKTLVWAQEEPMNQGAWYQIKHHLDYCRLDKQRMAYAGRPRSPSPAVGYYSVHVEQQKALIKQALVAKTNQQELE